ncbi:hypothetical protein HanIR_Chr16g0824431 [Helianthus annuus]|nr:hypothetical protein HanIR_Chr16g0824431 [Helianthus annuus]
MLHKSNAEIRLNNFKWILPVFISQPGTLALRELPVKYLVMSPYKLVMNLLLSFSFISIFFLIDLLYQLLGKQQYDVVNNKVK